MSATLVCGLSFCVGLTIGAIFGITLEGRRECFLKYEKHKSALEKRLSVAESALEREKCKNKDSQRKVEDLEEGKFWENGGSNPLGECSY